MGYKIFVAKALICNILEVHHFCFRKRGCTKPIAVAAIETGRGQAIKYWPDMEEGRFQTKAVARVAISSVRLTPYLAAILVCASVIHRRMT